MQHVYAVPKGENISGICSERVDIGTSLIYNWVVVPRGDLVEAKGCSGERTIIRWMIRGG